MVIPDEDRAILMGTRNGNPQRVIPVTDTSIRNGRQDLNSRSNDKRAQPTVAEFFAGIGLVRLAMERQGFKVVFANDIDAQKLQMYHAQFGDEDFHLGDIHEIASDAVPRCDVYTASFPCNDLSVAGSMAGLGGAQSSAFWGLIRILKSKARTATLPRIILLENVPGFLLSKKGKDFEAALSSLNDLGYACDAVTLDAVRFVAQSRVRLFIIARLGATPSSFPFGLQPGPLRSKTLLDFIFAHSNIDWCVGDYPDPPNQGSKLPSVLERLADDDNAWWSRDRAEYFMNQLSKRHAALADEMIAGKCVSYATAFRRVRHGRSMAELRNDGIAGCLRTPKGGSARQILFKAGRGRYQVRLLTARECARLQGVPDSYPINTPLNQALYGFGDAVCVPVIEWIAEHCIRPGLVAFADTPESVTEHG